MLISEGGGLVCESVGKAVLLSDYFDSKQYKEAVDLLLTCHPSPSLTIFASYHLYTLSGHTGSALVWYSEGRTIEPLSVQ